MAEKAKPAEPVARPTPGKNRYRVAIPESPGLQFAREVEAVSPADAVAAYCEQMGINAVAPEYKPVVELLA